MAPFSQTSGRPDSAVSVALPLDAESRARGRRIAISSHPLGMTFSMAFTSHLPTLALVSLGAGEAMVGLQSALGAAGILRLPTLRAVAYISKRSILIGGQLGALLGGLPLLFFPLLADWEARGGAAVPTALGSLVVVTCCLAIGDTVWFPLLRSYVEPKRIGRFFGTLRTGWHLALIVYFFGARAWLDARPDDYGPLFGVAWLCGMMRVAVIARLPERSERTGERIRIREAFELLRTHPALRRYLLGVTTSAAVRTSVLPFVLVMMRREIGFEDGQILYTTVALFAGGFVSLYLWGRIVDRIGPAPVFGASAIGCAILILGLLGVSEPGTGTLVGLILFFLFYAVLVSGFGVADTHVLFGLVPPEAPTRMLAIAAVVVSLFGSLAPLLSGIVLEKLLANADDRLVVYHGFFVLAASLQILSLLPLLGFRRQASAGPDES
jgi:predicted MFS family arabinose efflux permease